MDAYKERLARNEAIFRNVNERVEEVASSFDLGSGDATTEFVCECSDGGCFQQVSLSLKEYEDVRSSPIRFALHIGHPDLTVDRVVAENERFVTVEKKDEAAAKVEELDPRA